MHIVLSAFVYYCLLPFIKVITNLNAPDEFGTLLAVRLKSIS
jgi:hypothetical protein